MKWLYSVLAFAAIASALPTEEHHLWKRADPNETPKVGYAAQAGTTGGSGGPVTRVSSLAALKTAVTGDARKIVVITGNISGNEVVRIGANTSVLGASGSVTLSGVGLRVLDVSNVIIRNLRIQKVIADVGDAIGVQNASKVWLDHLEVSSDLDHDKDYYDGLIDITHGVTGVTVSYSYLHDHYKGSLVGHSDSNASEDTKITVTYYMNWWRNIGSRTPSFRFGRGHIFNNFFDNNQDGINTRVGAQLLVENNVWLGGKNKPLYSTDNGYAVARGNDFGGHTPTALSGTFTSAPYSYPLAAASSVRSTVTSQAGAKLTF